MSRPGYVEGKHYTQYVNEVKRLKREKRLDDAVRLLLSLIAAVEQQATAEGYGLAGWYYFELAKAYHTRMEFDAEIQTIETYMNWHVHACVNPNVNSEMLCQLERARQARGDRSALLGAAEESASFVSEAFMAWRDGSTWSRNAGGRLGKDVDSDRSWRSPGTKGPAGSAGGGAEGHAFIPDSGDKV